MSEPHVNGTVWLARNLVSVIVIVTALASVGGNWFVMGERIKDIEGDLSAVTVSLSAVSLSLNRTDRDLATLTVRVENLRDIITEMRRQGGLSIPIEP